MMGSGYGVELQEQADPFASKSSQSGRIFSQSQTSRARLQRPPAIATSNSLWDSLVNQTPSTEIESFSVFGSPFHKPESYHAAQTPTPRVHFDETVDFAKTREMTVAASRRSPTSQLPPAERLMDLVTESLSCSGINNLQSHFIADDEDDDILSEGESEASDRSFSPRIENSVSFDAFGQQRQHAKVEKSKSKDSRLGKYQSILVELAKERKEWQAKKAKQKTTVASPSELPLRTALSESLRTNVSARARKNGNLTKAVDEAESQSNNKPTSTPQSAVLSTANSFDPLTKATSTFLDAIGSSSKTCGAEHLAVAEAQEATTGKQKRDTSEEQENSSRASSSFKENGDLPDSAQVYDRRFTSKFRRKQAAVPSKPVAPVSKTSSLSIHVSSSLSNLTEDAIAEGNKMCLPPIFQKRLQTESKAAKRDNSTVGSSGSKAHNNPAAVSDSVMKLLKEAPQTSSTSNVAANPDTTQKYIVNKRTDADSKRHAYVAYFERSSEPARNVIQLYEHPIPTRFPTTGNEIIVEIKVSSVSDTDVCVRTGQYWGITSKTPLKLPIIPGVTFCGSVSQIDKSAGGSGLKVGDQVVSLVKSGANSRYVCIQPSQVVKIPKQLTAAEFGKVACLPEVYLSAFQALHIDQKHGARYKKNSLSGKSILILGGTTPLGRALCELAIAAGSETVYATAKYKKSHLVEEVAGAVPIDPDPHHWYSILVGKMDCVICVDKGNKEASELKYEHIQTLGRSGKLVLIGAPSNDENKCVELSTIDEQSIGTNRKLHHFNVFEHWDDNLKESKKDLLHLVHLLRLNKIEPKIVDRLPLTKVARAQEIVETTTPVGFVLCEPWLKCNIPI